VQADVRRRREVAPDAAASGSRARPNFIERKRVRPPSGRDADRADNDRRAAAKKRHADRR
jgi:hypothetical protein